MYYFGQFVHYMQLLWISLTVPKRFKIFAHIVSGSILISCLWSCCVNAISHSQSCCCTEYRPAYDYPQPRDHSWISESMLLFSTTVTVAFSIILYVLVNQQAKSKPVQIWESSSTYLCPFWLYDLLLSWAGNIISFCQVNPHRRKRYHMRWSENTHRKKKENTTKKPDNSSARGKRTSIIRHMLDISVLSGLGG